MENKDEKCYCLEVFRKKWGDHVQGDCLKFSCDRYRKRVADNMKNEIEKEKIKSAIIDLENALKNLDNDNKRLAIGNLNSANEKSQEAVYILRDKINRNEK